MPQRPAVLRAEPRPAVIPVPPELRRPALRPNLASIWIKTEIPAPDRRLPAESPQHRIGRMTAMMPPGRTVHPPIKPPSQPIRPQLLIPLAQPAQQGLARIRPTVPVRVLQKQNVRCRRHDHSTAPRQQTIRKCQPVRKNPGTLVPPVAIPVFQHPDPPARLPPIIHPARIVRHLHNPQPPRKIPVNRHRVRSLRFRSRQFHPESRRHSNRPKASLGRQRRKIRRSTGRSRLRLHRPLRAPAHNKKHHLPDSVPHPAIIYAVSVSSPARHRGSPTPPIVRFPTHPTPGNPPP